MNKRNRGFSLVSAIFLVVILSLLATYLVTIGTVQRQTSTFSVLGTRALFAADSGVQWAIHSVLTNAACPANPTNFTLSGGAADGFQVKVQCSQQTYTESPDTFNVYTLRVTASRGNLGGPDYISRRIRAQVTDAP